MTMVRMRVRFRCSAPDAPGFTTFQAGSLSGFHPASVLAVLTSPWLGMMLSPGHFRGRTCTSTETKLSRFRVLPPFPIDPLMNLSIRHKYVEVLPGEE